MSRFFFLSHDGAGLPLAWRLKQEGHTVVAWVEDPKAKRLYDGMLKKVKDWREGLEGDPLVVVDSVGIGILNDERPQTAEAWEMYDPISEQIKRKSYRVFGGSKLCDRLEFDRTWGAQFAKKAGLLVPETHRFETFEEAIAFVNETKKRYIMKPHGNQAVFSNYPSHSWEDMVSMLEHFQKVSEEVPMEFQEMIGGQQLSIEGWWNGHEFIGHNSTFEFKPFLHGDIGPYTGETGSVVFAYPKGAPTKMQTEVLLKLEPYLREAKYPSGALDVNTIVNEDGAHFLEFTARMGYPALYLWMYAVQDDLGKALEELEAGTFGGFSLRDAKWFLGARVFIPEWPYGRVQPALKNAPMFSRIKPKDMEHITLVDAYFDGDRLRCGGTDGELMVVSADGETIREAQGKVLGLAKDVSLYPMGWRDDIGDNLRLDALTRWGYWLPAEQ